MRTDPYVQRQYSAVVTVCQQVLGIGGVDDLTIQDVPLEDIISELFSRGVAAS